MVTRIGWAVVIVGFLFAASAEAQTWDGGGADNNWGTAANWSPDGVPAHNGTANLIIAGNTRLTPTINVVWSINSLTFSSASSSAFNIGGSQLTIGGGGITTDNANATGQSINNSTVSLGAPQTWTVNSATGSLGVGAAIVNNGNTLTIDGVGTTYLGGATGTLSGSGGLTKNGAGTLQLTGPAANTFSGTTAVNTGTLVLFKSSVNATITGDSLIIGDGLGVAGVDVVQLNASDQIGDATPVTINSTGQLLLTGTTSDFLASTTFNGGSIVTGTTTGFVSTGNITTNSNATTASISGRVNQNATFTWNVAAGSTASGIDLDVSAVVFGAGGLNKSGAGTLRLAGVNTLSGGVNLNAGKLIVSNGSAAGTGAITMAGATTLQNENASFTLSNNISLSGGTATFDTGTLLLLGGAISGGGSLTKTGAGQLDLVGAVSNSFSGTTTVNAGSLVLSKSGGATAIAGPLVIGDGVSGASADRVILGIADQISDSSAVTINNSGQLNFNGLSERVGSLTLVGGAVATGPGTISSTIAILTSLASAQTATISGNFDMLTAQVFSVAAGTTPSGIDLDISAVVSNGILSKTGTGTLRLSAVNTFAGGLNLDAGKVILANNAAAGTGAIAMSDGTTIQSDVFLTVGNAITLSSGTATFDVSASQLLLEGVISSNGSLTKTGNGTLRLRGSSSNTYSGTTTVSSGVLSLEKQVGLTAIAGPLVIGDGVGGSNADQLLLSGQEMISDNSAVTVNSSGLFNLASLSERVGSLTLVGGSVTTFAGTLSVTSGLLTTLASSQTATISGNFNMLGSQAFDVAVGTTPSGIDLDISAVVSSGALTKFGAGTLRLSGANTFAGGLILDSGKLLAASDNGVGSGPVTIRSGATLQADGGTRTLANSVILSSGIATIDGDQILDLQGSISGAGSLTKNGIGTLILSSNNTNSYTGTTTVNNGLLLLQKNPIGVTAISGPLVIGDGAGIDIVRLTSSNQIVDTVPVTINGSGSLHLLNVSDTIGSLTMTGGSIATESGGLGIANNITTLASSTTATISGNLLLGAVTRNFSVAFGTAPSGIDLDIAAVIADGGIIKQGAGTLRLSNANTFSGGMAMSGGTLLIGNNQAAGTGTITYNSGTMRPDGGPRTLANAVFLNSTLTLDGALELSFTGPISSSGAAIVKNGASQLRLSGANSFGGLTVNGGPLIIGNDNAAGVGPLVLAGAPVQLLQVEGAARTLGNTFVRLESNLLVTGEDLSFTGDTFLTGSRKITVDNANIIFSGGVGQISGNWRLTKDGLGNLILSGNNTFDGGFVINEGAVIMNGGALTGALTIGPTGSLTQNAGTYSGTLTNQGTFTYNAGIFAGQLINEGTTSLGANFVAGNGVINFGAFAFGIGQSLTTNGAGLDNQGTITLSGGTIDGNGPLVNNATLSGRGTIAGSAGFANNGVLAITGGNLSLTNSGANANAGTIAVPFGVQLRLTGGNLVNTGLIDLDDGTISGTATVVNQTGGIIRGGNSVLSPVTNSGGLIHANSGGTLLVQILSGGNTGGGELRVEDGSAMNVVSAFASTGTIVLKGSNAVFSGGTITHSGTLRGTGRITNTVLNSGTIRAELGNLTLSGSGQANTVIGRIEAPIGGEVLYTQGLAINAGQIALLGGTFDNNNQVLTNSGAIEGEGVMRTGGLTNTGSISVGGGDLDVLGPVTNNATVSIQSGSTARFFGPVNGPGNYTGTGTTMFLNSFSPGASPAQVNFGGNLIFGGAGSLTMELAGTTPGSGYDQVHVAGSLSLGGTLDVSLTGGFLPQAGNSFDILNWGALSGSFSSLQLPTLGGPLAWDTSQLYTSGVLAVAAPALPGDFNFDGTVDAADYVVWRKTIGTQDGYNVWRTNFGGTGGAGGSIAGDDRPGAEPNAVPEPRMLALLSACGIIGTAASGRRLRK